ncbi:C4-dicarboxylate ABC transporter [Betaproteobacteria bacterium]|nr:C4-dicarboxylate ABC transporter [Betaproteobacteria bacterium]
MAQENTDNTDITPKNSGDGNIDFNELMRKFDTESAYRIFSGWLAKLMMLVAVAMSCFHFYTSGFGLLPAQHQGAVHLAFTLLLTIFLYPASKNSPKNTVPWYDIIVGLLGVCASMYLVVNYMSLIERSGMPSDLDLIWGFILIFVLLEATRRISNPVLPCLAIICVLYCYFGNVLPGSMGHRGFSISRIINHMYLGTEGIFGTPLEVSSTFVFMFILFGSVLEKTGVGKFIIDISLALAGWASGGPAKVTVIASGIMGTVSGSSVANVCTVGMFTIPLMKSVGYKPHFAAAVEAAASTGGQIMPPVMGAGAFIMAQFLGWPYIEVAKAAVIPALLYYTAVLIQVHFEAKRLGLSGIARENLPNVWHLVKTRGFLVLPLAAIIYLLVAGYTPLMAAFWGILVSIPLSYLSKETRLTPKKLLEALEAGARSSLGVACACACVGFIVGTGTLTGLALRIAGGIVDLAGGLLLPTLLLTMLASILLGTGLPTTANFIVTSTMAAPALKLLGVPDIAAYMFVFYFGIAADLTPPVALAAYAAAGIAGADPMKSGVTSVKLALAGFLVPFVYVYNPILLMVNATPLAVIQATITALVGVYLLSMTTIGYYNGHLPWWMRILAMSGALGLLDPDTMTDFYGLGVLAFIYLWQRFVAKPRQTVAATQPGDE